MGVKLSLFLLGIFITFSRIPFATPCMVSHLTCSKSSANYLVRVEFVEKGFEVSIFGHTFYVRFSKFFRVLCKVISKNNKINLCLKEENVRA